MNKKIIDKFYFDKDSGKPDINNYGKYRLGLTHEEVFDYLCVRAFQLNKKFGKREQKKYNELAGANTCAVVDGIVLSYRHDILRYADCFFNGTSTYMD